MAEPEAIQGASGSPPPFLTKTYDMVDDPSTNAIVSWSPTCHTSFVVWNPPDFSRDLLPKYFKHNNFSSFVRQLNTYGFKKVDPDQWEFGNDDFVRGHRELLYKIQRRKPVHSHSLQNQVNILGQLAEQERQELEGRIENLKRDNSMLRNELQEQFYGTEHQMQSLEDRLFTLELRQRQMMHFLSKVIQRPGFLSNFLQHSDPQSKKRKFPKANYFIEDAAMEDNSIISLMTPMSEKPDTLHSLDMETIEKVESSLHSLENLFRSVSQASGDDIDMYYDNTVPCLPSTVNLTKINNSSGGDTDMDPQSSALKVHSPSCLEDVQSSPEIAESTSHEEGPAIHVHEAHPDARSKVSEIDVNSEPTLPSIGASRDETTSAVPSTAPAGVNDGFWEQFLTETPGSSHEVQSERRNSDEKNNAGNMADLGYTWWKNTNVDHLTERMGNLSSAKKT